MGQKTNPIGLRVAVNKDWRSKWYAGKKEFGKLLTEDRKIRDLLKKKLESASVPRILIERAASRCRITIQTARPGVVIGRKGAEIDKLKEELSKMTGKEIYVDIMEIKTPELDAQLVAENIALQLERRVSFRRPFGRRGTRPRGVLPLGPRAAAHPARADRLRFCGGQDGLRQARREMLDLQG
jgi:small subunit ribosomal protein S3